MVKWSFKIIAVTPPKESRPRNIFPFFSWFISWGRQYQKRKGLESLKFKTRKHQQHLYLDFILIDKINVWSTTTRSLVFFCLRRLNKCRQHFIDYTAKHPFDNTFIKASKCIVLCHVILRQVSSSYMAASYCMRRIIGSNQHDLNY